MFKNLLKTKIPVKKKNNAGSPSLISGTVSVDILSYHQLPNEILFSSLSLREHLWLGLIWFCVNFTVTSPTVLYLSVGVRVAKTTCRTDLPCKTHNVLL